MLLTSLISIPLLGALVIMLFTRGDNEQSAAESRYIALFTFVFLIATIWLGHRYWTYPPAQQAGQYAHFLKNLALMGGALLLFWSGAGRYSVDAKLRR